MPFNSMAPGTGRGGCHLIQWPLRLGEMRHRGRWMPFNSMAHGTGRGGCHLIQWPLGLGEVDAI